MAESKLDLTKRRSPSNVRNLLEVRVRRLGATSDTESRIAALRELRDIAAASLEHDYGVVD